MNKAFQINLGGFAFTIDDNAYRRLDTYLLELEKYFRNSESRDEIIADIEARFAELLRERLRDKQVIELEDVEAAIKIMGTPHEFEDDTDYVYEEPHTWDIKTGRRLYRHPDDKVIGGVCAGLAAYFGIEDPIWVRIAFAIVFLTMGFGLLLYLIMWAIVPEAKTAGDRLAMMGEPANVHNIARTIERGLDDLSETIKDNWNEFKSKKKSNRRDRVHSMRNSHQGWCHLLMLPVYLLRFLWRAVRKLYYRIFHYRTEYYEKHPYV